MRRVDAGDDAAPVALDAGAADAGTPATRRPPPRPDVDDGPPAPELVLLLNEVRWDQGEDWERIGFDLDGLVTVPGEHDVECLAAAAGEPPSDGDFGTDNALGQQIVPLLLISTPDAETAARTSQAEGIGALLVRVRDWNGGDDPSVTADVLSTGGRATSGIVVSESALIAGDPERPLVRDDAAYVTGGLLVARLPDRAPLPIAFGASTVTVRLTDAMLVVELGGGTATLAGRWSLADLIDVAPQLGMCGDDERALFRLLDLAADIRTIPGTGGEGVVCDAVSAGIELRVEPAGIAGVGPAPEHPPLCP